MKTLCVIFLSLVLIGCATTYKGPATEKLVFKKSSNNVSDSMAAIKKVLVLDGFSISISDDSFISTNSKPYKVTPEMADCGTTMGLDYLKDSRTNETVSINVIAESSDIQVITTINATYLPSDSVQSKNMICVSKGIIEQKLLDLVK